MTGIGDAASSLQSSGGQFPSLTCILLVDDDAALRRLVGNYLTRAGYRVIEAESVSGMRRELARAEVHIVILDVMMPGEDGLSAARTLAHRPDLGIIMVSALGSETDRIVGLETGADDYLPKPVSPRELLAHIRALQRRRLAPARSGVRAVGYEFDGWRLDPVRRILRDPGDAIIGLSDGELSLLLVFVEQPQTVLSRDKLLELSRGVESDAFDRAIDTQVSRIRRKLAAGGSGEVIRTVRSEGYMFLPPVVAL